MSSLCLTVDDDIGMPTIANLRDTLIEAITPGRVVRLDLSAVTDFHLCLIQLILAARRHATGLGADLALAAPATPALTRTLERAGVAVASPGDAAFWFHGEHAQ